MLRIYQSSLWWPILSGVLLSLTLPYFGVWPLVWVALLPLFMFASNRVLTYGRLVWGTMLFGMIYAVCVIFPLARISGWWWSNQAGVFGDVGQHVLFAGAVGAVGFWGALFFLPLVFLIRFMDEKPYGPFVVACAWVFVEWLRSSFALFGYSWGVLGYTLIDTQYIKHAASVHLPFGAGGVYTLSFVIVLYSMVSVDLLRFLGARSGSWHERIRNTFSIFTNDAKRYASFWFFILLFFSSLLFGVLREYQPTPQGKEFRVALIASQIPTESSIGEGAYRNYRTKLETAFASGATVIVTPENVFPFFELNEVDGTLNKNSLIQFGDRDQLYTDFLALLRTHPTTTVVVGLHSFNAAHERYNSIVYYTGGVITEYYHKRKLVPFTEYAPFGGVAFPLPVRFVSGEREQYADIEGIRTGALLCSEVSDTTIPLHDIGLLLSPSNDSVFVGATAATMHHQMARMRALETGAYVLRASKGGISSVIDPKGEVLESGVDGVIVADIFLKVTEGSLM